MTKLKTLKDIECSSGFNYSFVDKSALKAEAIKWVKDVGVSILDLSDDDKIGVLKGMWIHFFNITEDDLQVKGGKDKDGN